MKKVVDIGMWGTVQSTLTRSRATRKLRTAQGPARECSVVMDCPSCNDRLSACALRGRAA